MASRKEYLTFLLDQLGGLEDVSYRAMMGEYVLYCRGRVVGGVYDDRLLVKITPSAAAMLPHAPRELPYPGGREMLLVENVEDRDFLRSLVDAVAGEVPAPRRR